jgi:hypothetical protein
MNKEDRLICLGTIIGICACSEARDNLGEDFTEFINWIREKIEEDKK